MGIDLMRKISTLILALIGPVPSHYLPFTFLDYL